ncbi:MAG: helix-turn-helix domain-containing protein [Phycisphaerae bacterium]
MPDFRRLATEIRRLRGNESALALARRAGLSMNYVRNVERGERRPRAGELRKLLVALGADETTSQRCFRWAGIAVDVASAPDARRARRAAWRSLLYVLVNHVWLPRLELEAQRAALRSKHDRALVAAALSAPTPAHFVQATQAAKPPSNGLRDAIESAFEDVPPDTLTLVNDAVANTLAVAQRASAAGESQPAGDPLRARRTHWRWAIARLLMGMNRPTLAERDIYDLVRDGGFDYNFAVCLFPAVYWHACRAWPFERVFIECAARGPRVQRELYDAIAGGLDLLTLSLVLFGETPLGVELAFAERVRPSPPPRSLVEQTGPAASKLLDEAPSSAVGYIDLFDSGPPGLLYADSPADLVFDHWDRTDFLSRFPLFYVDRDGGAQLARALDLPSWSRWQGYVQRRYGASDPQRSERPLVPLTPQRFARTASPLWLRGTVDDTPESLDSYLLRAYCRAVGDATAAAAGKHDFGALHVSSVSLAWYLHSSWQEVAASLAKPVADGAPDAKPPPASPP